MCVREREREREREGGGGGARAHLLFFSFFLKGGGPEIQGKQQHNSFHQFVIQSCLSCPAKWDYFNSLIGRQI